MSKHHSIGRLADMLRHAYRSTHSEDDLLAVPDDETSAVLQFLRLRVIPSQFIAEEFDRVLQRSDDHLPLLSSTYARDLYRFLRLSATERALLFHKLMAAEGYVCRDGRWYAPSEGFGDAEVFVYDGLTGRHLTRSGIGAHALAMHALYDLVRPAELGRRWPLPKEERMRDLCQRMLEAIAGFIIRLPGWHTPFLHLWVKEPDVPPCDWLVKVRKVQQLKLFLVAQHDGDPIPSTNR